MNTKSQVGAIIGVGIAAFSGGIALGHFLAQKKIEKRVDEELNKIWRQNQSKEALEKEAVRAMTVYSGHNETTLAPEAHKTIKSGRLVSWGPAADGLGEIVSVTPVEGAPETDESDPEPESKNIFDDTIPGWDYETELTARSSKHVYIITHDEFFGNEMGLRQDQLTYYKGDDIMCDALEKPIHNYRKYVGDDLQFGHGSKDPNIVFVRNEKERMEWEITLDVGTYEEEVLGLSVEEDYREQDESIQHSVRRFVMGD